MVDQPAVPSAAVDSDVLPTADNTPAETAKPEKTPRVRATPKSVYSFKDEAVLEEKIEAIRVKRRLGQKSEVLRLALHELLRREAVM